MSTDCIEKKILVRAPRQRVWRALSDSTEFGHWFGVKFDAPFEQGAFLRGVLVGTAVDAEVAKLQKPHEGKAFEVTIERIEPERIFSFRWHPHAIEPGFDYSAEPTTLVVFSLEEVADGVQLTLTESGFDQISLARRASAFAGNDGGWTIMLKVIARYVENAE
jgi:uncharacterized protein YndB with AHSA1/START domain